VLLTQTLQVERESKDGERSDSCAIQIYPKAFSNFGSGGFFFCAPANMKRPLRSAVLYEW
jgi:hypothetical protein